MMKKKIKKQLIVALASPYLIEVCETLLKNLSQQKIISHLVVAKELQLDQKNQKMRLDKLSAQANYFYDDADIAASIASGSYKTEGLIILGHSSALLSEITTGITHSLIARATDVVLKERKKLVYVVDTTPWDADFIHQLINLTELNGIIYPLMPAFYNKPESIKEMIQHTCARMLDLFQLDAKTKRWF